MQRSEIARWSLIAIAVLMIPAGLQAAFAPRSFFDEFPLGRGWISAGDASYDEHLVRDVGALFLALIVVTLWCAWRREAIAAVAVAWLVQGVLHLGYHVGHLDGLGATDKAWLVVSLALVPILALVALFATLSERQA
ncbi:MAG TPA: hypothetical protein VF065_03185 [Ilumatobacter sp.]